MKFKRVEIQAFKSYLYKQDGTFDFTVQGGEPADIVSIYAPNGFGKTSFYDAIDYCMTNNITRYIRDPSLANINNNDAKELNQSGQKQHILRTKNAPEEIDSVVKITTTNKGSIERKVLPARNGSRDYTFEDKKTKVEERYFRSVMLSQEAIDCFLKELKPESRYEQFMAQQLGGDDTLEKDRQHIQLMLGRVNNRLDKIQSEIDEITNKNRLIELGEENSIDSTCLKNINDLVLELNEKGGNFSEFDNSFNEELKEELKIQVSHLDEKFNQKIEVTKNDKFQLENLIDSFHVIELKYGEIERLNGEIKKLSKQKIDIEKLSMLNKKKSLLIEQLNTQREFYEKVISFEKRLHEFCNKVTIQNEYSAELTVLQDNLTKNEQDFKVSNSVLGELERQKNTLQDEIKSLEIQKNDSVNHFSEIDKLEVYISQKNSSELESKIYELNENVINIKSEGVEVKNFKIEDLDFIIASKFNNDKLLNLTKKYSLLNNNKKSFIKKLDELNNLLESSKLQESSVSQLIKIGSQLINQHQDKRCPLCQHKHDSFSALADAINSNSSLSDSQQRLLQEIEAYQSLLKNEENELKVLKKDFFTEQECHLNHLRDRLQDLLKEQVLIKETIDKVEKNKVEVTRLKGLVFHKTPELYQKDIDGEIERRKADSALFETKINNAKEKCEELIEKNKKLKVDFAKSVSQKENHDELLSRDLLFLVELDIPREIIEPKIDENELRLIINARQRAVMKLYHEREGDAKINNDAINTLTAQYTSDFFEDSSKKTEEIEFNISKINEELVILRKFVREFDFVVQKTGGKNLLDENNWEALKKSFVNEVLVLNELINQNEELRANLKLLIILSENVLKYIKFIKSTDDLIKLQTELGKYNDIKDIFLTDLREINESLELQINQYFHIDLINTIYRKIDPHPDFKRIDFSCSFPEGGKPKLQVFITDEDGSNIVSPTLSFSSAQINVLSLSIFLAKAINTTNAGESVDCIFIDDPVQSMDSINVLGVIDLLRSISINLGKQIIISTHDDNFHALLKQKLPEHLFKSKFLELESFGKVAQHAGQ